MTKNIFPQFLREAISHNFSTVCTTTVMVDIEKVSHKLPGLLKTNCLQKTISSRELKVLQSYKMEKRRHEWFSGRVCAKMAAADFVASQYGKHLELNQIVIGNIPSGRPYITWPDHCLPQGESDLSISHSGRYAIAVTASAACGIDIQEPRQTLIRVKDRFCLDEEEALLNNIMAEQDEISSLTLLWAAKEAVRKTYSLQFIPEFLQLTLDSVEKNSNGWFRITFRHSQIRPIVICGFYQGYGIAICIIGGHPIAGTT